ncbi:hypothetical protein B0H14DRAFT_2776104 [Mycena olivaceomarginata]|nr:hypothetical protein B0H14DRAFT_2776104 [Mycena olivaceomarginata]
MPTSIQFESRLFPVRVASETKARLDKPFAIPRVLQPPRRFFSTGNTWGKPFVRAYSPELEAFGITEKEMLDFIDELNIKKRGNLAWNYVTIVGTTVKVAGHADPTQITKAVGHIINDVGKLGALNSACGPKANKVAYLRKANRELFGPKGLCVRIVTARELRERLGMPPNADLALPIEDQRMTSVPTRAEIVQGKRAEIPMSQRQISALDGRVAEMKLVPETADGWRSETNHRRKWARKGIYNFRISSEISTGARRNKVIQLRDKALAQLTETEKQKGLNAARRADSELTMANRNRWLLIEEVPLV